jgi:hypothetical protein
VRDVQDRFFDRVYWMPAAQRPGAIGIATPLGATVVYDSTVHQARNGLVSDGIVGPSTSAHLGL